jgi:hypothetical protein
VQASGEIFYCEERIYPDGAAPVLLGVAVIPLPEGSAEQARAILLLRPKGPEVSHEDFRLRLLSDAGRLRESCGSPN